MPRKRNSQDPSPKIGENGAALTEDRKKQLAGYISETEHFDREIADLKADQKAIFDSAKDAGFHTKAIRHIVKERKVEKDKREAFEAVVDVYKHALGMLADLPLGQAATTAAATEAASKAGNGRRRKSRQMDITERSDIPPTAEVAPADTSEPPFALPAGAEEDEGLRVPDEV